MKNELLLLTVTALSAACNSVSNDGSATREMFDAGNQEVITPSINQRQGTVSLLYGNLAAQHALLDSASQHNPGEMYTLATWEQADDLHWYGSHINGRLERVETVNVLSASDGSLIIDYKLVNGSEPKDASGRPMDTQDRIKAILNQRPAIFP
jgi:hypothetical protein